MSKERSFETIVYDHINKRGSYPREKGKYWASDLSSIIGGYLRPEDFGKPKAIDILGCQRIITGNMAEAKMVEILRSQGIRFNADVFDELKLGKEFSIAKDGQIKRYLKITDEITLTVKPDFVFNGRPIVETKYPFSMKEILEGKIPKRYTYQLEVEHRAFNMPVQLGLFFTPFNLRIMDYKPSKVRWNNIKKKLIEFHKQVK